MNLKLSIVNYQLSILVVLATFFVLPLKAQVKIGDNSTPPKTFSVLELSTTKVQGGLRLPQLTTTQREALNLTSDPEADGLVIYNTTIDCVEYWSVDHWIDLCNDTSPASTANSITLTSAAGTDAQTVCGGATITPVTYSTTGATGATVSGLPSGVSGVWNANLVTVSGAPITTASGVYNYTVTLTGGSGDGTATGTITVNEAPQVAISGQSNVAKNTPDYVYTANLTSGTNVTYSWSVSGAGWSIPGSNTDNTVTVTSGTADGTISVTATNDCGSNTASMTVHFGCTVQSTIKTAPYNGWITFMCYNLGASASVQNLTPTDQANAPAADNYGDLYQWGRTDDNHQFRNPLSTTAAGPVSGANLDATTGQVIGANADKFITNGTSPYDWRNPQRDTLWYNNGKTVNDPCPSGWRVPTTAELQSIVSGNTTQLSSIPAAGTSGLASGNKWVWSSSTTTKGWLITPTGSSTPTLFLPAAGYRGTSGAIGSEGASGYYWSSSAYSTYACNLYFYSTNLSPGNNNTRSGGMSVRCVSE